MTRLWRIESRNLQEVKATGLASEAQIEEWVARDPSILSLSLLIIGRQVVTDHGGRIDLLGIDSAGDLTVIELKRDQTPRDVIAQTLDYGSWVRSLTTPKIYAIARNYLKCPLSEAFRERFDQNPPDVLNSNHNLLIVAGSFDPSSSRIVEYLAEAHGVSINTAFFTSFRDGNAQYLAADFLMDQEEVIERSEAKVKAPWEGYFYVNAGNGEHRDWKDMRKLGFVAAGHGTFYSSRLKQLSLGDPIFVYQKGEGYVGYGIVKGPVVRVKEFVKDDGEYLAPGDLMQPGLLADADDPELSEYLVAVDWKRTFSVEEARWLNGGFANQNVVCKLRDQGTLEFLKKEFGVPSG